MVIIQKFAAIKKKKPNHNMSKGKLIEQLTSIIEETTQGNENVTISHDVKLEDKYGNKRQIDVLVEYYQNERFTFRTIIECKFKSRDGVEVNQMLAFIGTLESFPDVHQGVFVSSSGFQEAARKVANENNIKLYTIQDLTKKDVENWIKGAPIIRKTIKKYEILDWRVLIKEEHKGKLLGKGNYSINPDEILVQDSGEEISIRNMISTLLPFRANQLHNHLLNASIGGHDVYKEKYVNLSFFPLKEGISLIKGDHKIPIGYIELKILFWLELEDADQTLYKLYKDQEGKVVADVVAANVDYSGNEVLLSVVEDMERKNKGYYLIDEKQGKIKLEIEKQIDLPEKNQTTVIIKNPMKK